MQSGEPFRLSWRHRPHRLQHGPGIVLGRLNQVASPKHLVNPTHGGLLRLSALGGGQRGTNGCGGLPISPRVARGGEDPFG